MVKALFEFRNYIISNAVGELKYRFAGSSLGFFWNIINPILQIMVYTFVFSDIMKARMENINSTGGFSLYLCAGMFAWISFNECIVRGANTFVECSSFLKKLSVPECVFVAQKTLSSLLSVLINYVIIFFYSIIITGRVTFSWLWVPLILFLLLVFGFGLALLLATVNVFFQDTVQIVNVLMLIWMWTTPIVYAKDILPERFEHLLNFNPVYPFISSLQDIIAFGKAINMLSLVKMLIIALCSMVIGCLFIKKNIAEVRDLI